MHRRFEKFSDFGGELSLLQRQGVLSCSKYFEQLKTYLAVFK